MSVSHIVITHQYPLNAPGGGTRSCLKIMQHLRQLGVEVTAIQVSSEVPEPVYLAADRAVDRAADRLETSVVSVVTVEPNSQHYLLTGLSVAKAIKTLLAQRPIDAVLSWGYEAAFLPQLLQKENIVFGMIAAMPSYAEWVNRKTKFRVVKQVTDEWFRWRPFKLADVVYVSSEFTKAELIDLFAIAPTNISVTGRGIDTIFHQARAGQPPEVSNFIFYGSLAPIKGVFDTIEALGIVAQRGYVDWQLNIAGWGDTASVVAAAKQQGIWGNVKLLGRLEPNELADELTRANLAILPSRAESFGRSIAEAQAASLAVVSYDTGSIPEVVEAGKTGWLATAGRPDQLADAIIAAIDNPEQTFAMGKAGHERVTRLFTWEKTAQAIVNGIAEHQRSPLQTTKTAGGK